MVPSAHSSQRFRSLQRQPSSITQRQFRQALLDIPHVWLPKVAVYSKLLRHAERIDNWYDLRHALGLLPGRDFVMAARRLPNYIKSQRKSCGLSQREVAFLLASGGGAKISRYEHFKQQPNLETALALAILFRTPARTLFRGVSEKVERRVIRRIAKLARNLEERERDPKAIGKIQMLDLLRGELRQMRNQTP